MKHTFLTSLAKQILASSDSSISKVRFAKIIYFTFKSLVRKKLYVSDELEFIRMPLGPVPVGFMELSQDKGLKIEASNIGLMYNRQNYLLTDKNNYEKLEYAPILDEILSKLESFSTSKLVELSHDDYSWKNHLNGQQYFLVKKDFDNLIPKSGQQIDKKIDDQLIQARLVHGMEVDAVKDSTYIEYPNYPDYQDNA